MNVQKEGATDAALAVVFGSRNEFNIHKVKKMFKVEFNFYFSIIANLMPTSCIWPIVTLSSLTYLETPWHLQYICNTLNFSCV